MGSPMKQRQETVDSFVALRVLAGMVALVGSMALVWKFWKVAVQRAGTDLGEVVFALATLFFICVFWHFAATGRFVFLRVWNGRKKGDLQVDDDAPGADL